MLGFSGCSRTDIFILISAADSGPNPSITFKCSFDPSSFRNWTDLLPTNSWPWTTMSKTRSQCSRTWASTSRRWICPSTTPIRAPSQHPPATRWSLGWCLMTFSKCPWSTWVYVLTKGTTLERADFTRQLLMFVTAEKERRMVIIVFFPVLASWCPPNFKLG